MNRLLQDLYLSLAAGMLCAVPAMAANDCDGKLGVTLAAPLTYRAPHGERFIARYGSLSDGSLEFVKLRFPDGNEYTLPAVLSGSGVRYSDDILVSWWEHQGKIRLEIRNDNGDWIEKYGELRAATATR